MAQGKDAEFFVTADYVDPFENVQIADGKVHKYKNQSTNVLVATQPALDVNKKRGLLPNFKWWPKSTAPLPGVEGFPFHLVQRALFSGQIKRHARPCLTACSSIACRISLLQYYYY